eukprot:115107_1
MVFTDKYVKCLALNELKIYKEKIYKLKIEGSVHLVAFSLDDDRCIMIIEKHGIVLTEYYINRIENGNPMNELEIRYVVQQIVDITKELSLAFVIQCDFAPRNWLIDEKLCVKCCDYGVAVNTGQLSEVQKRSARLRERFCKERETIHSVGETGQWFSPDIIYGDGIIKVKTNSFNIGLIICYLHGKEPKDMFIPPDHIVKKYAKLLGDKKERDETLINEKYENELKTVQFWQIHSQYINFPTKLTPIARSVVLKCFHANPAKRIAVTKISEEYWFKQLSILINCKLCKSITEPCIKNYTLMLVHIERILDAVKRQNECGKKDDTKYQKPFVKSILMQAYLSKNEKEILARDKKVKVICFAPGECKVDNKVYRQEGAYSNVMGSASTPDDHISTKHGFLMNLTNGFSLKHICTMCFGFHTGECKYKERKQIRKEFIQEKIIKLNQEMQMYIEKREKEIITNINFDEKQEQKQEQKQDEKQKEHEEEKAIVSKLLNINKQDHKILQLIKRILRNNKFLLIPLRDVIIKSLIDKEWTQKDFKKILRCNPKYISDLLNEHEKTYINYNTNKLYQQGIKTLSMTIISGIKLEMCCKDLSLLDTKHKWKLVQCDESKKCDFCTYDGLIAKTLVFICERKVCSMSKQQCCLPCRQKCVDLWSQ